MYDRGNNKDISDVYTVLKGVKRTYCLLLEKKKSMLP